MSKIEELVTVKKYDYIKDKPKIDAYFKKYCKDEYFEKVYGCNAPLTTEPTEREPTNIYITYDKNDKSLVGYVLITKYNKYWVLNLISSRAITNPKYKGTGTLLIETIIKDMKKEDQLNLFITGFTTDGIYLYYKMGFKVYGSTGILCLSLNNSIIHPNLLREHEVNVINYSNNYRKQHNFPLTKLYFTKKQDSLEFRKKIYTTIPKDVKPENAMIPTESMLKEINDYPSELYKYGRTQ